MKQIIKHTIVGTKAIVPKTINVWPRVVWLTKLPTKLKSKPMMASVNYLQKFILVSAKQNLSPCSTTVECHVETRHKNDTELSKYTLSLQDHWVGKKK